MEDVSEEGVSQGDVTWVDEGGAEPVGGVAVGDVGFGVGEAERTTFSRCPEGEVGATPERYRCSRFEVAEGITRVFLEDEIVDTLGRRLRRPGQGVERGRCEPKSTIEGGAVGVSDCTRCADAVCRQISTTSTSGRFMSTSTSISLGLANDRLVRLRGFNKARRRLREIPPMSSRADQGPRPSTMALRSRSKSGPIPIWKSRSSGRAISSAK